MSQAGIVNATVVPLIGTDYVADAGTATPAANILNVKGAVSITTSGVGNTLTITGQPIFVKKVFLSAAEIKALNATPKVAITAAGANKAIVVLGAASQLYYGGTTAFTAAAAQTIELYYGTATPIDAAASSLVSNSMITSVANKVTVLGSKVNFLDDQAQALIDNVNVTLYNPIATEITGNIADDSYIMVSIAYFIADLAPPS